MILWSVLIVILLIASFEDLTTRKVSFYYSPLIALLSIGFSMMGTLSAFSFFSSFSFHILMAYILSYVLKWGRGDLYIFIALSLAIPILGIQKFFIPAIVCLVLPYILGYNYFMERYYKETVPFVPVFLLAILISFALSHL